MTSDFSGFFDVAATRRRVLTGLFRLAGDGLSLTKTCVTGFSSADSGNLSRSLNKNITF